MSTTAGDSRRLAEALRAAGADARPLPDCPPADQIWSAVHLELPVDERLRIVDHTVECPVCAEAWRLAMEMTREGATALPSSAPLPAQRRWPLAAWASIAAAGAVLAVGAVLMLQRPDQVTPPETRDGAVDAIETLVPEGATLPRADFRLRWTAAPEGTRYDLVVTTSSLEVIVDARGLERAEYQVPAERLAALPAGERVLWRVVAHAPDGTTLSSPTYSVTLQ